MISFIGMGLLGSNFTKALLKKGEQVSIWNRTYSKAKALEAIGAKAYINIADAVKDADRIHLTLPDDKIIDEVLDQAKPGLKPGCIIIDHSTTSTRGAERRTSYWKEQGCVYLHAPVFMGPQNALESSGYMLVSGDQDLIQKLDAVLSGMTGKLINYGSEVSRAAGIKLLGNSFLIFLSAGLSETLALAKSMNIPTSEFVKLFDHWNPGTSAPGRLKRILAADYDNPSWELIMARKDARLMIEEAGADNRPLIALAAIANEMDKLIQAGFGHKDWSILAKDNI